MDNSHLFGRNCDNCGTLILYADDATYKISNRNRRENQAKLTENLKNIGDYLNNNELVINMERKNKDDRVYVEAEKGENPGLTPRTSGRRQKWTTRNY